jgi:hypothetical protein
MRKLNIYFSDFFNIPRDSVEKYGAFNISLISDLPLFIDPFLLFNSEDEKLQELHAEIIKYVIFLKGKSRKNLQTGSVEAWYYFKEIKQNWLGYSKTGNNGRGLGRDFANSLKHNLTSLFSNFGEEDGVSSHIEKLTLVKDGVGRDQISDFTCNLICGFLAEYTQRFAQENINQKYLFKTTIQKSRFNYETETWVGKQFTLPKFNGDFVLLTPTAILTKDESWISSRGFTEDFSSVMNSISNTQMRSQIENYFVSQLPIDATKEEQKKAIERTVETYPTLLDEYIKSKEKDPNGAREFNLGKLNEAQTLFVKNSQDLIESLDRKTDFYNIGSKSRDEALARVHFLKSVIENQDGYRIFYVDEKPIQKEHDLQIMFKLTWFASISDLNAEVNNGRGPADFVISNGSKDKIVVEFKLAKNTHLERNLEVQAEIYSQASRASHPPIKAILFFKDAELTRVNSILQKLDLLQKEEIVLIDARPNKSSASKA